VDFSARSPAKSPLDTGPWSETWAQDAVELAMEPVAVPILPAAMQPVAIARETQPPMGMERHRDDGGVMGPVLERGPRAVVDPAQRGGAIGWAPRPEDQVMGARQRVDAVDLNEAQPFDEIGQRRSLRRTRGRLQKRVALQEQPPRLGFVSFATLTAPPLAIIRTNNRTRLTDPPAPRAG
jgi:hypothetical protein